MTILVLTGALAIVGLAPAVLDVKATVLIGTHVLETTLTGTLVASEELAGTVAGWR